MTFKTLAWPLALVVGVVLAMPAQSAVLFTDNFDTDSGATQLNFTALNNWAVTTGSIDYIKSGGYGISCFGGTGGCLDMDGSSSQAGLITSLSSFTLTSGVSFTLSAEVSGNQRGGSPDTFTYGLVDANTHAILFSWTSPSIASTDSFSLYSQTWVGSGQTGQLFFQGVGSDDVGVILDNVAFESLTNGGGTEVPEPATLALLGLGLAGFGLGRRRKAV